MPDVGPPVAEEELIDNSRTLTETLRDAEFRTSHDYVERCHRVSDALRDAMEAA